MNFKEALEEDLSEVFFNLDEFAEEHKINGKQINIIVDNDQLTKRSKVEYEGVMVGDILYFVKVSEYGKPPKINAIQDFDGIVCRVFDVRIDSGIYEIILKKNVS